MKVSRYAVTAAALFALVAVPQRSVHAQNVESPVHFGLGAGLSVPLSTLSQRVQTGFLISGMLSGTPQGFPVELRGEVTYTGFAGKGGMVSQNITGLNINAVLPFVKTGETPYFIGGLGLYHTSAFAGLLSENDFGFNFGGGYRWPLADMSAYVELRYFYVAHSGSSRQMLPLTFGVSF